MSAKNLRNIAIIAHVDHGKTTLVDALFHQGGLYRSNQAVQERAMDSNDQERERGITILAKATSVTFPLDNDVLDLQIVDTPGHADFGGEVERSLQMVDGVLLLVDAAEGPLPQTRFVLRKALERSLPIVIGINKIDRKDARPQAVLDEIYDLFIDLGADEDQLGFPVIYAVARDGIATDDLDKPGKDLVPLVRALRDAIPPPDDRSAEPFLMQANQLAYDDYVGRLVVGRVVAGAIATNQQVRVQHLEKQSTARVTGIFKFRGTERYPLEKAECGDIVALAGLEITAVGDTITAPQSTENLTRIHVDEPTVAMVFQINNGPLVGRSGGQYVTSRQIRERLHREAFANVSISVEDGETPDQFRVMGRGELQLAVLIESMRRERYEMCARNPQVITRETEAGLEEPTERVVIDVPMDHMGATSELLGKRRATLLNQLQEGSRIRMEFLIPTRGLFGLRNLLLTATRGTAIQHSVFENWTPWMGPIPKRASGALVSDRAGVTTPYALYHLQPRGTLFVPPGTQVYEGMVVGEHTRPNDLNVNVVREKKQTNVRSAGKDDATSPSPHREMSLERSLEWVRDDEMVEVTPDAIRMRKRVLAANQRPVTNPDV